MIEIRSLRPDEAPKIVRHLQRLDAADRRRRFGRAVEDSFIDAYVRALDWRRAAAVGYLEADEVRAVLQLAWPRLKWLWGAEFAASVEAPWRGRGIATELLYRAVTVARNRRLPQLFMTAQADNEPALRLARRFGFALVLSGGEAEGRLPLAPPDGASLIDEALENGRALIDSFVIPPSAFAPPEPARTIA